MTTDSKTYKQIMKVVEKHRLVEDRVNDLESNGFTVEKVPMGSGGIGQIKEMQNEYRIQIGYGQTKHNYAHAVIIQK